MLALDNKTVIVSRWGRLQGVHPVHKYARVSRSSKTHTGIFFLHEELQGHTLGLAARGEKATALRGFTIARSVYGKMEYNFREIQQNKFQVRIYVPEITERSFSL